MNEIFTDAIQKKNDKHRVFYPFGNTLIILYNFSNKQKLYNDIILQY